VRFLVAHERLARVGFERETQVVVIVLGLIAAGRNAMHVDVVDLVGDGAQRAQSRFLARFAQGRTAHVGVAVDVAAELQPAIEFAMVQQHRPLAFGIDDPGRRRYVTRRQRPIERTHAVRFEKRNEPVAHRTLALVERAISTHIVQEFARGVKH